MVKTRVENALAELCDRYCIWAYKPMSEEALYQNHCRKCPLNVIVEELNNASGNQEG